MNNSLIQFDYNGAVIPFMMTGNDVMINATEMIKLFPGKRINNFLRTDQTTELLVQLADELGVALKSVTGEYNPQLIKIVQGGIPGNQGTWMHRKIAIAFAMWLSPVFYSWCLGKIDEIINQGYAFRDAEIQRLSKENTNLQGMIQSMQPQVNYYKDVLTYSELSYSTEQICKELNLGCSSKFLLNKLEEFGYIYRRPDNKWFLSSGYDNCGYIVVTTKLVTSKGGKKYSKLVKRWTEEGKHWIWSLKKKLGFN